MKLKLTLSLILLTLWARPCGFDPEDDYYFYNVFSQTSISEGGLYPFLRDRNQVFFSGDGEEQNAYAGNFLLWQDILLMWSEEELERVLNKSADEEFENIWKSRGRKKDKDAKEYMRFARMCSDSFAYRYSLSWDYDDILRNKEVGVTALLDEAVTRYSEVNNKQLKARYAYQIIRAFHYSRKYTDAIMFFEERKDEFEKDEIYYYCLDQIGGCYYSIGDFDKAAYSFLQVFDKSMDRKASAGLSYRLCQNKIENIEDLLDTNDDRMAWYTLQAWQGYLGTVPAFRKVCAIDPASSKAELLFMRALNDVEREVWPKFVGVSDVQLPTKTTDIDGDIKLLSHLADSLNSLSSVDNKDFWLATGSYLDFLNGDKAKAVQKLEKVKSENYADQKHILSMLYEVFSWKEISREQEVYMENNLREVLEVPFYGAWGDYKPAWRYLVLDQIAHLYYKSGKLAESFLCHNKLNGVETISSPLLIDDLKGLLEKKNKTPIERMLVSRGELSPEEALGYVYEVKGLYYLQQANPREAYTWLKKSKEQVTNPIMSRWGVESLISAKIFSNNTMECFRCEENEVMVDSVYLADAFSFIQWKFDKKGLADNLIKLDSLAKSPTQWKVKLANYLLANYYFNVSNTGYFRGTLTNSGNCCHYSYLERYDYRKNKSASDKIQSREGYNLSNVRSYPVTYYELADVAYTYYEKVLENSTDPELNARCLYMMAKCELNTMYNDETGKSYNVYYDGGEVEDRYRQSFKTLKTDYAQTEFYQQTLKECSFFKYYVSL